MRMLGNDQAAASGYASLSMITHSDIDFITNLTSETALYRFPNNGVMFLPDCPATSVSSCCQHRQAARMVINLIYFAKEPYD